MRTPVPTFMKLKNRLLLSALVSCAPMTAAWGQENSQAALDALLRQADFWQENKRPDLARQALERYLTGRPDDPEVLYRLARQAVIDDQPDQVAQWTRRLEQASPNSQHLIELDQLQQGNNLDTTQLNRARQLARANRYEESASAYRTLFGSDTPPRGLAVEYYQTLAGGTDAQWRQARDGLRQFSDDYPNDAPLKRALSEVLTYREGTRREGISQLAQLARQGGPEAVAARSGWRQALLWLEATPADETLYQVYTQVNPDDADVSQHFEDSTAQNTRAVGFTALQAGQLGSAEESFRQALEENPQDAEAKGGLGLILLRRQQFAEARDLLSDAMDQAPERREQWAAAYQSAAFYARLGESRRLAAANNLDQALEQVRPLTQQSGDAGRAARLLEADILRRQKRLDAAEQAYRAMLETRQSDVDARVGLVQVLSDKGDWAAAQQIAQALPESRRAQMSGLTTAQVEALRLQARQQDDFGAEAALREALDLAPSNPWARLDLARLLAGQSRPDEAQALMGPFLASDATVDQRYAAALFASEQGRWSETQRLLSNIPSNTLTVEMKSLQQQAQIQQPLNQALAQLEQGNQSAAIASLQQLYLRSEGAGLTPSQVSQIAGALSDAGAKSEALRWVERDLARGIDEQIPNDYINHALVMAQAGRPDAARQLLNRLAASPQWREDTNALAAERGLAIIEADQLRQSGRLASAYDVLAEPMQQSPDDEDLLLAMGRLYADGGRQAQAEQIYTYVLTRHPESEQALQGAVQTALANNRSRQASQLLSRYGPEPQTPDTLLLSAQVARANGESLKALALLSQARQRLSVQEGGAAAFVQRQNPFTDRSQGARASQRPNWLPGASREVSYDIAMTESVAVTPSTSQQIDELSRQIRRERAPTVATEFAFNLRDGESGLSRQDRVEAPVRFSLMPFGEGRFEVALTPTQITAGTPEGDALRRYGGGALGESTITLFDQTRSALTPIYDQMQSTLDNVKNAQGLVEQSSRSVNNFQALIQLAPNQQEVARLTAELETAQDMLAERIENLELAEGFLTDSQQRSPLFEVLLADLNQEQRDLLLGFLGDAGIDALALENISDGLRPDLSSLESFNESRMQIEAALANIQGRLQTAVQSARPSSLRDSGAGLALSYANGSVNLDMGSTPLGFEETNLVGGIHWQPEIAENTTLNFTAERRAVKDSVLSYAGAYDAYSGDTWGGVVRTGGRAGINYDTEAGGLYADIGTYRYTGHNVADNQSYNLSLGGYARPVNNERRQLQAGVHVSAMAFDDDLSHFTYGHGGYFSPQDYVSVAFPINYRESFTDQLTLGGYVAPGFQSYSTDDSDYFPTDPEAQALLDVFSALGATPTSRYSGESESGIGLSFGGAMEYQMTPDLSLGGRVDFNSFGDYNDTSASMFMNYIFGDSGERAR
ncbi:cellulose synthase subunit BcsC-related outer membrane protein [Halomonas sp. MC140]|nr:cellulose biosynthesis protein BcsC [Halomonas sp. MC140]MDN7132748.1 cellulose synthase subunit BcsC-related outer membrane protein [Halomonas sp. MC140]